MKKLYYIIAGILLLYACDSKQTDSVEPENPADKNEIVQFEGNINPISRATDTQFDTNDEISVFGVLSSGNDNKGVISSAGNYADNVKYFYDGTKFTSSNGIELPTEGKKVYYHAIYPYCSNAAADFEFSVKTDQLSGNGYTLSDLSTANTVATAEKLVPLKFSHRLSRLILTLKGGNWPAGDMQLQLNNVYTRAKVNLNSLDFQATGSKGNVECASNGTNSFKAILPPQTLYKDAEIATLTIGNETYNLTLNGEYQLRSGVELSLSITLNTEREIVEFEGDINPWEEEDTRLDNVVPSDIREELEEYMPIYTGVNPPNIEGIYFMDPSVTVYCEDEGNGGYSPGTLVYSKYIRFSNQNTLYNTLDYEEKDEGGNTSVGKGAFISGSDNNFTAFFNVEGYDTESDIHFKTAMVISGTKTLSGVEDLIYAFIMVEKDDDPNEELMDEGVFRVFKDQDGLAVATSWPTKAAGFNPEKIANSVYDMVKAAK